MISQSGRPLFQNIISNISELYSHDLMAEVCKYGVFISGKDFQSGVSFAQKYTPTPMINENLPYSEIGEKVSNADLCILLEKRPGENPIAIWGEVEGNKGSHLLLNSFWTKKKSDYYSFGIGVKQNFSRRNTVKEINNPPTITGQWVKTNTYGWKYVVIIESQHSVIRDFHDAIGTIQLLMAFGPDHRFNHDPAINQIISLIRDHWDKSIIELISILRSLLPIHERATMGTNEIVPLKITPSIVV